RLSDALLRGPALPAGPAAVARVLREAGYEPEEAPTRPHAGPPRSFERARPNQLWQTDLFTFVLKRQNRRLYLVAFLDDHRPFLDDESGFLVSYGLHASQSSALVLEALRAGLASYGPPEEVLTDNGSQYVTWRGKSAFSKELEKRGIRQVVSRPRHPQTLGKIERFWGTLWRECVEAAVFLDLADAQRRIGLFIDHYNFQRPHQGIGGLGAADRFFRGAPGGVGAARGGGAGHAPQFGPRGGPEEARHPRRHGGRPPVRLRARGRRAEGERVILTGAGGRREVDLVPPPAAPPAAPAALPEPVCPVGVVSSSPAEGAAVSAAPPAPGTSPLDASLPPVPPAEGGGQ